MLMFNEYLLTSAHDSLVNAGTWWMRALVKVNWLDYNHLRSGRGSARLERTVRVREVPSSNLGAPTLVYLQNTQNTPTGFFVFYRYTKESHFHT